MARSSGRPFKTETSPAITVYGSICRAGGGQNAISRGGAGKGYAKRCKIKIPPSIRGAAMPEGNGGFLYTCMLYLFSQSK